MAAVRARHSGDGRRARRRRDAEEQRGQALHVRLHPRVLQRGDGGQRGRGRPLVRGQEEQPAHAGSAAAGVAGGMHGSNRLGGNSLSDLLVFGRRAGLSAALYAKDFGGTLAVDSGQVADATRAMLAPFERAAGGENPYSIQSDLQETMQTLVGIIRRESELVEAIKRIGLLKPRARNA